MIDVPLGEHIVIIVFFLMKICTRMSKTSEIKHAAHVHKAVIWLWAAGFWYHQGLEGNFCYAALTCPEGLAGFDSNGSPE